MDNYSPDTGEYGLDLSPGRIKENEELYRAIFGDGDSYKPPQVSQKLMHYPDGEKRAAEILATRGANLCSPPDTPVWPVTLKDSKYFSDYLQTALKSHIFWLDDRAHHYSDAVNREWPMRKTPAEIVTARADYITRLRAQYESAEDSPPMGPEEWAEYEEKPEIQESSLILETQGACLATRPSTPVQKEWMPSQEFAYKIIVGLLVHEILMDERHAKYGEHAAEWRVGHTPPSVASLYGFIVEERDHHDLSSTCGTPDTFWQGDLPEVKDGGNASQEFPEMPGPEQSNVDAGNDSAILHSSSSPPKYTQENQWATSPMGHIQEKQGWAISLPVTPKLTTSPDSDTGFCIKRTQEDSCATDDGSTPESETGRPQKLRVISAKPISSTIL
ncbi:hypothetical protein F503_04103 [Ophiostoma piceae UAMH 11346]|uniref:Uncharacterized protein n=1 Tax=Ophiostoma piceae (strain UAMH 11346) TaxID=1262450 RepID=S3C994_OPHP1|nr:hypothetical protein F503_04103 [Ophiostoma piceae UAMH 11346]